MRTIVLSDVHGEPSLVHAVVAHSNFDHHADRLIFAGDAIEVGRDSAGALAMLEELGAEFLLGNHECTVFSGWSLEGEMTDGQVKSAVRERITSGAWRLAAEAEGVLITHAGVSDAFAGDFERATAGGSVADFARSLNRRYLDELVNGDADPYSDGVCDEGGPLWYRPGRHAEPLRGVAQVAGHTPLALFRSEGEVERLAEAGMHLVDPHVRRWRAHGYSPPAPLRYAIIEAGVVTVVSE